MIHHSQSDMMNEGREIAHQDALMNHLLFHFDEPRLNQALQGGFKPEHVHTQHNETLLTLLLRQKPSPLTEETLVILLQAGAPIVSTDQGAEGFVNAGLTPPLTQTYLQDNLKAFEMLLKHDPRPKLINDYHRFVLRVFDDHRPAFLEVMIQQGVPVHEVLLGGTPLISVAILFGAQEEFDMLLKYLPADAVDTSASNTAGRTALMHAANTGQVKLIEPLLKAGCPLEAVDAKGHSAFSIANNSSYGAFQAELLRQKALKEQIELELHTPESTGSTQSPSLRL